jgi:hypothetical protein
MKTYRIRFEAYYDIIVEDAPDAATAEKRAQELVEDYSFRHDKHTIEIQVVDLDTFETEAA